MLFRENLKPAYLNDKMTYFNFFFQFGARTTPINKFMNKFYIEKVWCHLRLNFSLKNHSSRKVTEKSKKGKQNITKIFLSFYFLLKYR